MRKFIRSLFYVSAIFAAATFTSCNDDDDSGSTGGGNAPDEEFYGLTPSNSLVRLNSNNPSTALSTTAITGLTSGVNIRAIDFRPATGQLYGLGSDSRIYVINHMSGAATAIGAAAFSPAVSGDLVGFDFNPTVDRIRLVTSSGQNLRLNPETGAVAATDGNLDPTSVQAGGAAYTNNEAGASSTILYTIGFSTGKLYKQDPPNDGTLVEVGNLDIMPGASEGGFDISEDDDLALASFTMAGQSKLYHINLNTGKARDLGNLSTQIIGLAIPTEEVAYAVTTSNQLQIFDPMDPDTPVSKAITNLQSGENILGIDLRPANGQLYALGSTGRLYTINMANGEAAMVGSGPFATLEGTNFGFDFNPLVDRIRIVSDTGQNLRVNPNDGSLGATDGMLNPGTPNITSAAYTNNFAGTTSTTLFVIDATTDNLYKQDPPNDGVLTSIGSLGVDTTGDSGFDIGGTSNTGYAILTVGSSTKIYSVNTTTGTVTALDDFPNAVRGFAVGLGF